ncbi:MAG TPA: DEAD/DEAH box helicase [Actinocrinis sp.]|nr:DEAD/DEAH box helicase [Actinocrinis sp.]
MSENTADTVMETAAPSSAADHTPDTQSADAQSADAQSADTQSPAAATAALDTGTDVTFASLELPKPLVEVLSTVGVVTAFPIQAATIPDALFGRDVLGRGRTGSGKTLAFGLPTLARLEGLRAAPRKPLALVLVPTRELAMQVEESLLPYARAMRLRIRAVYGGAPMRRQIDNLRYGVELLVATPGRLSDLIERGECELDEVDIAVLDEADQMCDMGFLPHVCELMDQVAEGGQRLLFSATLDGAVDEIVKKYMKDPVLHEVDPQAGVVATMSHHLLMVAPQHKAKVAAQIAGRHKSDGGAHARSIFFVRTQMAVDRVTEQLRERGLPAAGLHGGMTQVARTKTLEDFKEGRTPVLIATDVAARGIHVDGIDLVVHIDPPRDSKDYLHRAGRTARAGQSGVVASLVLPKQRKQAQRMMDDAGVTAQELDAAPVGLGGKWTTGATALVELTGACEVPEPGDVAVFSLPVRERESRFEDRRGGYGRPGGDRFKRDDRGRDDRRRGGDFRSGGGEFRSGGDHRSGGGGEKRGGDFRGRGGFDRERGGFNRDRGGFERSGSERNGTERTGSERTGSERPGFDRNRGAAERPGGGDRFNRDEQRHDGFRRDREGFDRGAAGAGAGAGRSGGFRGGERGGFDRDRPGFERREERHGGGFNRERGSERQDRFARHDGGRFNRDDKRGGGFRSQDRDRNGSGR